MQSAEAVVEVLRARGRRGLPCERLYRQLFNIELFLMAWGRIYANDGAMTPGINGETADGMSLAKIGRIIDALRHERYRFQPVKRVYIPKKNSGKMRPLGLPSWSDKLVGEVVRILLEAYYEPRFSGRSHGFRPGRGCHTALTEVAKTWKGTTWFIEGDISDCFGSLDHQVMISVLAEHIHDNRFLRLIKGMLRAGYLEDWVWNATLSGAPQGGGETDPGTADRRDEGAARPQRADGPHPAQPGHPGLVGLLPALRVRPGVQRAGLACVEARLEMGELDPPAQRETVDRLPLLRRVQPGQARPLGIRRPRQRRLPAQVRLDDDHPAHPGQGLGLTR